MLEKHYTIKELAELLNMSRSRVRQLVMNEPGVLRFAPDTPQSKTGRRANVMYRIPQGVVERILRRNANPPAPLAAAGKSGR
jgi:hypothetical protein